MKKWHYPFLALLIVGTVLILSRSRRQNTPQHDTGFVFGTTYSIKYLYEKDLEGEIRAAMMSVDRALSMFNDSSTISRINRNELTDASSDTTFLKVFRKAMQVSEMTHGAFDITVAPAVNAWGFGFKNSELITDTTIDSLKQITGYRKIHERDGIISKDDSRIMLDCSAIAKGYGCDAVAQVLRGHGIADFMVEIGGEIVVSGKNAKGEKWNIAVNNPDDTLSGPAGINTVLHLTDCAMATSGNYRNYYEKDGVRYAHTIDPHSCRPVQHSLLSATVIAPDCATADAFATSFMVMGADSAIAFTTRIPNLQAYLLTASGDSLKAISLLSDLQ